MLGGGSASPVPFVPGGGAWLQRKGSEQGVCLSVGPDRFFVPLWPLT